MADPVLRLLGTGATRKHSTSDSLSSEAARKLTNLQIPTGSSLSNLRDGSPAAPGSARPGASRAPSRATSVGGTPEPSGVRQGMARRGTTAAGSIAGETATARGEEDAEDSDLDEGDFGNAQAATAAVSHQEAVAEKMRMRMLLESFDEQQMARYEVFRRVGLNKNAVKRLANHVLNQSVTQNVAVVIAGASKVFVGELVERARAIQQVRGETGPLSPDCLREAYRQYKQTGLVPQSKPSKRMFR